MTMQTDTSKIFQRASEAVDKGNYDYAIALLLDILAADPDDVKVRMALRNAEKSKFERMGRGKGTAVSAALSGIGNLISAWLAIVFKKYDRAIMQHEKYLMRDPFSVFVLSSLARVFESSGREESAIVTLEFLRQNNPDHVGTLRKLAHIYVRRNDIQRAMQRYQKILQLRPNDIEASKQMHDLAATESIQVGWDKGDSFQDKIRDKDKAVRLEQAQKIVRTADEAVDQVTRVKRELDETPDRPLLWAELGDLQRRKNDYGAAIEAYQKALELDPKNQLYLQKLMDAKLGQYDAGIYEAAKALQAAPADGRLKAELERLQDEKQTFWLEELRRRVDERPTESALRFELGQLYFQLGKVNEATAEFQRIVRDTKFRLPATAMLAKCFALKGLEELAIGQYERAMLEGNLLEEFGKDVAYNLGTLYEKVGNYAAAEDTYKKVFEVDIGFRDIADKMERVYRKRREKSASNPEAG